MNKSIAKLTGAVVSAVASASLVAASPAGAASPDDPTIQDCSGSCVGDIISPANGALLEPETYYTTDIDFASYGSGRYRIDTLGPGSTNYDFFDSQVEQQRYTKTYSTGGPGNYEIRVYRCNTSSSYCTPSVNYSTVTFTVPQPIGHYETQTTTTYETERRTDKRFGVETTSASRSSGCFINRGDRTLRLGCRGGDYAKASYKFVLPDGAYDVRRSASTVTRCCAGGVISKNWYRPDAGVYEYRAKVTRRRVLDIRLLEVSYSVEVAHTTETQIWVCDQYCP